MLRIFKINIDVIFLTLIYIGGLLHFIDDSLTTFDPVLLRSSFILLGTSYFLIQFIYKKNYKRLLLIKVREKKTLLIWLAFSFSVTISQMIHKEVPSSGILYLLFSLFLCMYIIPRQLEKPLKTIIIAGFISAFTLLILSVIIVKPDLNEAYRGIFSNPNQVGLISSQLIIMTYSLILLYWDKFNLKHNLAFGLVFLLSTLMLFLSESRTSLIATFLSIIIGIVLLVSLKKIKVKKYILPSVVIIIILIILFKDLFIISVWDKFIRQFEENRLTAGRIDLWAQILSQRKFFGHGSLYFLSVEKRAHNFFFNFLGLYGYLPAALIGLFFISVGKITLKLTIKHKDNLSFYILVTFIIYFFLFNLSEGVFGVVGTTITLIFYNLIGLIIFKEDKASKKLGDCHV